MHTNIEKVDIICMVMLTKPEKGNSPASGKSKLTVPNLEQQPSQT